MNKSELLKRIYPGVPSLFLIIVTLAILLIFQTYTPTLSLASLQRSIKAVSTAPEVLYAPKSYYMESRPELASAGKFLSDNLPEGSRVLFMNNTQHEMGFFAYFVIEYFSDKRLKYFFSFHIPSEEEPIINNMRENRIDYLFVFKDSLGVYKNADGLLGSSYILKLSEGELRVMEIE
jgi:hypothetical protein